MGLLLMVVLSALATIFPATMGPPADPLTTPEVIKPEWFFYVAFRWLKLFTGTAAVLSMGLIVLTMFALAVHRLLDSAQDEVPGSQRVDRHRRRLLHRRPDGLGSRVRH